MRVPFRDHLAENLVLFDGAMGTQLYARGIYVNQCFDAMNLDRPDLVGEIHGAYLDAGADVIETNTFAANARKLAPHDHAENVAAINRAGAEIARRAAGDERWVAGAIGPLGIRIEPLGPTSFEEARAEFAVQVEALAEGGVDLFVLETFTDLNEVEQAVAAVREGSDLPVIAQVTIREDGTTLYGTPVERVARRITDMGADAVGLNCSVGPEPMLEAAERMLAITDLPVACMPNAGMPRRHEDRTLFMTTPAYFGKYARRFIRAGVRIVGGCCGTTPEHVAEMHKSVRALDPVQRSAARPARPAAAAAPRADGVEPAPTAGKSRLAAAFAEGRLPVSAELLPPRGTDTAKVVEIARRLADAGVECVNIPDGPRASSRMSNSATALILERETPVETIIHYCCRDRNLLGMQSDILGLWALGLRNILVVTGDPPKMGDYPDATAVFDVDAVGLTNVVNGFNRGLDIGGNEMSGHTAFHQGVGCNPGAPDRQHELNRLHWKLEGGAEFVITQPVFDLEQLESFLEEADGLDRRVPWMAGVWPLLSVRNAEFLNNEIPECHIPEPVMQRMRDAEETGGRDGARAAGVEIACEMAAAVRRLPLVQGIQLAVPLNRWEMTAQVVESLGDRSSK